MFIMTFKEFLLESKLKCCLMALVSSSDYDHSFDDDILNSLIGNKKRLSNIDGNFILKAEHSNDVPYILMSNDKFKPLHSIDVIESFNKSLDANNSTDAEKNDFKVTELEKKFKVFSSKQSAEIYFNKYRNELTEAFEKTSRKELSRVVFIELNGKEDKTFDVVGQLKIDKTESVQTNPQQMSTIL